MASLDRQVLPQAQPVFNNPFSIKSILNLSEDVNDKLTQTSHVKSRPIIPIVPQASRPPSVGFNVEAGLSPYNTTQWLTAARCFPPWLLGTRFMKFLPGKCEWEWVKRALMIFFAWIKKFFTLLVSYSVLQATDMLNPQGENFISKMIYWVPTRLWWRAMWWRLWHSNINVVD